jgi:hypothetical protein
MANTLRVPLGKHSGGARGSCQECEAGLSWGRCFAHQSLTRSAVIVSFGPTMRLTAWPSSNCEQASLSAASLVGFAAVSESVPRLKRKTIRFLAVRMRSLNDPRQSSLPTVQTVTPLTAQRFRDRRLNDLRSAARPTRSTGTDASVTFRPLILTPAQRVSRS